MRKFISAAVLVCAVVGLTVAVVASDTPVRVFVNDREISLNPQAIVRDGTTYVGLRGVADALGATTRWDEATQTATVTLDGKRTRVRQAQGIMVEGRLLVPLRVVSEGLGCTVRWDAPAKAVRITKAQQEEPCPT